MDSLAKNLLWLDGSGGLIVGSIVLLFGAFIARLDGFSRDLVTVLGLANLVYGAYSSTLAARASRGIAPPRWSVDLLIVANATWSFVCVGIVATTWGSATPFGLVHVGFEGVWVAALAWAERRYVLPFAR